MNLKQIENILAIAEEGNISRAAEKLFMSQSALSQCLLNLEKELGIQLFKRLNKKLVPSYAGENYIESAKKILKIKERTYKLINDISDKKKGRFTVGITPTRGLEMFAAIYPKFRQAYPETTIKITESGAKNLELLVQQGKVDIGTVSTQHYTKEVEYEFVDSEELYLAIPKSHPMAYLGGKNNQGEIAIEDLVRFELDHFIATNKDSALREISDNICKEAGFVPNIIFEAHTHITGFIQAGMGIGFLSGKNLHLKDEIVLLSIIPKKIRNLWAAYRKDNYLTQAEAYYIQLMKEYYASLTS